MKAKAIRNYKDKQTGLMIKIGDSIDINESRLDDLKGLVVNDSPKNKSKDILQHTEEVE